MFSSIEYICIIAFLLIRSGFRTVERKIHNANAIRPNEHVAPAAQSNTIVTTIHAKFEGIVDVIGFPDAVSVDGITPADVIFVTVIVVVMVTRAIVVVEVVVVVEASWEVIVVVDNTIVRVIVLVEVRRLVMNDPRSVVLETKVWVTVTGEAVTVRVTIAVVEISEWE